MAGNRGSGYQMKWFKLHTYGWLNGSIRMQLTPAERGIWADLLAMASESKVRGTVCASKNLPYTREYIAAKLIVNLEELNSTIEKCCADQNAEDGECRMKVDEYGCLVINNFARYQDTPAEKLPENEVEREHRERMQLSKLQRKYPTEAGLRVVERLVVNDQGEILKKEQNLIDSVASEGPPATSA